MIKFTELEKGYDSQSKMYTIDMKVNGAGFTLSTFSEKERDRIFNELKKEL